MLAFCLFIDGESSAVFESRATESDGPGFHVPAGPQTNPVITIQLNGPRFLSYKTVYNNLTGMWAVMYAN